MYYKYSLPLQHFVPKRYSMRRLWARVAEVIMDDFITETIFSYASLLLPWVGFFSLHLDAIFHLPHSVYLLTH